MRVTSKAIIWSWVLLIVILGSLSYGAYSKLNPESLVSLLNTQVQKSYPGSKLEIAKINYGFSLDFKLKLNELKLTRSGKTIASANEVQLKVPWWLILFNRGDASVNVSDLVVFVSSDSAHTNKIMSPDRDSSKDSAVVKVSLPKYLVDAHYTLRAKNISIKEIDGERRFFTLSKLLVREFQYGKNSAFELNIPISISHKDKSYTSDLWLFGDITPDLNRWTLNYRGELKTKDNGEGYQFDDLVVDGKSIFDPQKVDLSSAVTISVEKKKVGTGNIVAKYDQIKVHLTFTEFPMDFLNLISDEVQNPFWKNIEGNGNGEVKFSRTFADEKSSNLLAKLSFPGEFILSPEQRIEGLWSLDFENEKWKTSFKSPKEEVKFDRTSILDFSQDRVAQYQQEIQLTSFDLSNALLAVRPLADSMNTNLLSQHTSVVTLINCEDGERIINGSFRYGVTAEQNYYQAELVDEKSKFTLKYVLKNTQQLSAEFTNFNWKPSYNFLLPFFSATEGILNGKLEGKWTKEWSDGTWLSKLSAENLQNPSGDFLDFSQRIWDYFTIDAASLTKRNWNGTAEKNTIKIKSSILDGSDPAQITGVLSTAPKVKSYLTLTYPKNNKFKPVKKDVTEVFWKKEAP